MLHAVVHEETSAGVVSAVSSGILADICLAPLLQLMPESYVQQLVLPVRNHSAWHKMSNRAFLQMPSHSAFRKMEDNMADKQRVGSTLLSNVCKHWEIAGSVPETILQQVCARTLHLSFLASGPG